jgi:hypothetical protein
MKKYSLLLLLVLHFSYLQAQSKNDWPSIPGLGPSSPLVLSSKETFIGIMSLAGISYILEEVILKKHENKNYYQIRAGMNNEYAFGLRNIWHQNIGIEHQIASWFAVSAEINIQQFNDQTPNIPQKYKFGIGLGLMTYYRWYLFGKQKISPYIEYGIGIFYGFDRFPYNGSHFTFNHSTQIGVEYTLNNKNKIRLGYGNFHQTNYGMLDSNPAYNGNGFSLSYAWRYSNK